MRDYQKDLEICERATEGPWEQHARDKGYDIRPKYGDNITSNALNETSGAIPNKSNAKFIATAREALPYYMTQWKREYDRCNQFLNDIANLRNENDTQREEIARLRELLQECMTLFALGANAMASQGYKKAVKFDEKRAKAREIERKIVAALKE